MVTAWPVMKPSGDVLLLQKPCMLITTWAMFHNWHCQTLAGCFCQNTIDIANSFDVVYQWGAFYWLLMSIAVGLFRLALENDLAVGYYWLAGDGGIVDWLSMMSIKKSYPGPRSEAAKSYWVLCPPLQMSWFTNINLCKGSLRFGKEFKMKLIKFSVLLRIQNVIH